MQPIKLGISYIEILLNNHAIPTSTEIKVATMKQDIQLQATIWIWALLTPALLACIPLMALAEKAWYLPACLFAAATVTTVGVWIFGRKHEKPDSDLQALQQRIAVLEEVISHVEDPLHLLR